MALLSLSVSSSDILPVSSRFCMLDRRVASSPANSVFQIGQGILAIPIDAKVLVQAIESLCLSQQGRRGLAGCQLRF